MALPAPPSTPPDPYPPRAWYSAAAAVLLAVHALLAVDTLRQKAVTVDEVGHLPAGISYWQKRTFELYHHNPPLVKLLAAVPALAARPTVDYSKSWDTNRRKHLPLSQWAFGWEFMYANAARYDYIYLLARLSVVAMSLLAGLVIFVWARELFGAAAGLLGLALWTFCPNAIAHAGLVTTDMGATAIGFMATYVFWKYLQCPTWPRATVAGVMLGLAQLTKFSLLLLYLMWPLLWLCWIALRKRTATAAVPDASGAAGIKRPKGMRQAKQRSEYSAPGTQYSVPSTTHPEADPRARTLALPRRSPFARGLLHFGAMVLISVLLINVGYLFEGTFTRLGDFTFISESLTRPRTPGSPLPRGIADHPWSGILEKRQNRFVATPLARLPVPLPRHYVEGFDEQKRESEGVEGQGYPVYLCGDLRRTGWWWYYFFTLAVKVPLGTWLLTLAALASAVWHASCRAGPSDEFVLLVPPVVVLVVMSFLTDINLGLRYVLPCFPFWFVLVSRVVQWRGLRRRAVLATTLLAVVWNVAACRRVHPDHLAYFNEWVGGPEHAHEYLLDSNLDWGQDLLGLARWLRNERPGELVGLAYFGNVDPSILAASGQGFDFRLAPPRILEDLEPINLTAPHVRAAIERWVVKHERDIERWTAAHPGLKLWQMRAFRQMVASELDLSEGPQPGLFAISANFLHALPFRLRDHEGHLWDFARPRDGTWPDPYGYFRLLRPIQSIGSSIFVYELTRDDADRLRAELGYPPLPAE